MMEALLAPAVPAPRRPSGGSFLMLGILGPLLLIALASWFSAQTAQIHLMRNVIRASFEKRIVATDLLRELSDAEAAERGYAISGDPPELRDFDVSRLQVAGNLARLNELYHDQPAQLARISRLQTMIGVRIGELANNILRRGQSDRGDATSPYPNAASLRTVDDSRAVVTDLIRSEEEQLAVRISKLRERSASLMRFIWGLNLLVGLILALALWALWRSRVQQHRIELRAHHAAVRLRAIFASTTDAIMILNPQGLIEAINAATTRMLGYSPAELVHRDASTLLDMMDGEGHFHARIGLVDGRLAQTNWLDRRVRHRDGHLVPVDIGLGLMPLPGELHIVAAISDISERKAMERLKDEFVATVSHELRTPLTSVVGSLGLLRGGSVGDLPEAAQRLVEIAENNSRRLIRLINDILDIEKIGSGRMRFERMPVDLAAMAERAIEGSRGLAATRGVRLELSAPAPSPVVRGDEERLLQVVTNLLSNAIRFTPEHSCVRVTITGHGDRAELAVEDEGPGIPAEFHGRIFERFAQARDKPASSAGTGTGLGLAISREIIVAHAGRIWFGSAEGGGARLAFSLPTIRSQPADPDRRRAHILLCEPQPDAADMLTTLLEQQGCAVDRVATAQEAEANLRSGRYDAMLTEWLLPDGDGLDLARALRCDEGMRALPVVVVSGIRGQAVAGDDMALVLDLIDWMDRPVDAGRLGAAIGRAVDRVAMERPLLLHVTSNPDMQDLAAAALADRGRVLRATSLATARTMLADQFPDIVILDTDLPDGSGLDLVPDLCALDGAAIPAIISSATSASVEGRGGLDAGLVAARRPLAGLVQTIRRILPGAVAPGTMAPMVSE